MKLEEFLGKKRIDSKDIRIILSNVDTGIIKDYCKASFVDMLQFHKKYNELLSQIEDLSIYNFENPSKPTKTDKLVLCVLGLRLLYKDKTKILRSSKLH